MSTTAPEASRSGSQLLFQQVALLFETRSFLQWATAFRLEEGKSLDFDLFPFQRELYEAFAAKDLATVDVMKSAQCGISAAGVSLALYTASCWEANVLYVLPSADDAHDFSDTRVKPAIDDSPWPRIRVDSTDIKELKRVGKASIYFRGSRSEPKALSIPADVLILDELDRLDHRNVPPPLSPSFFASK
jgi:phage terminase large subunit GpA-like protein